MILVIVDMRCTLNNALNELDEIKHKNTQCLTDDLSPNATVCDHNNSGMTVSLDTEYPCPAQPLRDPGHQHQQAVAYLTISIDSSILLTPGDCSHTRVLLIPQTRINRSASELMQFYRILNVVSIWIVGQIHLWQHCFKARHMILLCKMREPLHRLINLLSVILLDQT